MNKKLDKIARKIAKEAAQATYFAIVNAPISKTASKGFKTAINKTDIAKIAAKEIFKTVMSQSFSAQPLGQYPIDFHSIGRVLQVKAPEFYTYLVSGKYLEDPNVPSDLGNFIAYVKTPGQGKEGWATAENLPKIYDALASQVDGDIRQDFKTYLESL